MRIQLLLVLILGGSVSAIAQGTGPSSPRQVQPGLYSNRMSSIQKAGETKNPYGKLFSLDKRSSEQLRELERTPPPELTSKLPDAPKRKVVCGLTVWNVGPELDPRMVIRPPVKSRLDPKIEIAPTVCAE